ncbi:MAG: PhzF family phenazine biosynthesis protein [Acidimicrobiia bacterium]
MDTVEVLTVFQRNGAGGNPLGFVADSSGLAGGGMQEIATRLGFSETVFLGGDTVRPQVRILTPATELPFAGHPLGHGLGVAPDGIAAGDRQMWHR